MKIKVICTHLSLRGAEEDCRCAGMFVTDAIMESGSHTIYGAIDHSLLDILKEEPQFSEVIILKD